MLTQTILGRVYDYSHAVGGLYLPQIVGVAFGECDSVYTISRPTDTISGVPWNKTGVGAKIVKITIGDVPGDEEHILDIGRYGDADGEFIWPAGIALDSNENIYVTDEWMNRVSVFDSEGNFLKHWGEGGQNDGQFNHPAGIDIDTEDNAIVVDSLNHRVQKFTKDGNFLGEWGGFGEGQGELNSPWGIGLDDQNNVYVADHKNHLAQKFSPDGEYLMAFGSEGTGRGQLTRPSDVTVDSDGDVYVCDWANDRVQVYGPDGDFITTFIGDAQELAKWHKQTVDSNIDVIKARRRVYSLEPEWRFAMPTAVEFDHARNRLMVADTQRGRIQIYNKLNNYMEPQFNL
ncbi:MAG: hypothetical protein FI714_06715 [SAR202 cluster bacterium]|nr:hypothetical protein [SAR202 cluster bacterium]|tara:strand:+ start:865 stop:1899 length:1035 start_codon:yes stop_codon:yes gene_type:complete